jgi:hypothetical protein
VFALLAMVFSMFCAAFVGAFLVSFAVTYSGSLRRPFGGWPVAVWSGGVLAVTSVLAAFDLVHWEAVAFGGGLVAGGFAGQWLGALRPGSPE